MAKLDPFYVDLGARVRAQREQLGLTQALLADEIGISRTSLTNIECGRQRLLVDQLVNICAKLSISIEDIIPSQKVEYWPEPMSLSAMPTVANFVESVLGETRR